jgi:hypothetical protein
VSGSSLHLRNVSMASLTWPTNKWSADAVLTVGSLQIDGNGPVFSADAEVHASNANPVFALLFRDSFPLAFLPLTKIPALIANAKVHIGGGLVALQSATLHSDKFDMHGTYATRDDRRRAAFVAQRGSFSMGIRMDDDKVHLKLFGLHTWFLNYGAGVNRLILEPKSALPVSLDAPR